MEPPVSPLARAVPKLHLLQPPSSSAVDNASDRPLFPKIDAARTPSTAVSASTASPCSRAGDRFASHPPLSAMARVATHRLYGASVGYLDSLSSSPSLGSSPRAGHHYKPRPPPSTSSSVTSQQRAYHTSNNNLSEPLLSPTSTSTRDKFLILHPSLDLSDENGELSQLLLSAWSLDAGETSFASISLFCEMKLSEAKRMTSWVERPNRFFTTACCQLLDKYVTRLEAQSLAPEHGASAAFLRKVHDELVGAIFLGASSASSPSPATSTPYASYDYAQRVPFFLEYKKLRRHAQVLMANVENREQSAATKEKLPQQLDRVLAAQRAHDARARLATMFRAWRATAATAEHLRTLKCRAFCASRKLNLSALFRAWRIEALRRAYQRESVEYQTMLSITAASLSRKDVQIAEADSKMASMAKIIDSLTESNAQLLYRVEQLEAIVAGKASTRGGHGAMSGSSGSDTLGFPRTPGAAFDRIDSLAGSGSDRAANGTADDEKMDRTNRMLLETMFGMARMVESCAIQMSKDMMDSLEHQLDGSMLQQLADMVHADNVVKIKAEEARGLVFGASPPATPATPGLKPAQPPATLSRKMSVNVAFSNSTMFASLGKGTVAIKDLAVMPVDAFLLNWFKLNLQLSSAAEKTTDRTIKNFTSDLADGRRFSFLLHRLFPTWFDANMVHEIDADERLKNIAGFHTRVQPMLPQVVTSDSIHGGSATENIAFTAMLFGVSVHAIRRINMDRQREKFLNIITSWKRVRSLLLEVKRMNDNYDALMVVHLLKEMRTCETLFRQLNAELCSIAIASNESASTLSQIAYKVLQLTWRCLHAKLAAPGTPGSGVHTLDLVDERLAERVKDFTHVELGTVRQLLVNDSQYEANRSAAGSVITTKHGSAALAAKAVNIAMTPQAVTEKEVVVRTEAVRDALVLYCKDLHDIFKHYSASGGAGSIASMSLSEFLKFVRDCGLITASGDAVAPSSSSTGSSGKQHAPVAVPITQAMVEFVFHAALFFSPLTPREFIVATLSANESGSANEAATGLSLSPVSTSTTPQPTPTDGPAASASTANFVLPTADPLRPDVVLASVEFGEREMVGYEFVDALLRLAALKCPAHARTATLSVLDDRLRDFMELHVLPNALRSQSEIFRAEVASPKVRAVFLKHKPALQRVFRYYTSMHALREQQSTLDLKAFLIFARDCKLVGSFVTEHTLKQVLVNLQRGDRDAVPSSISSDALVHVHDDAVALRVDFGDFQEALAALTEYVICNPYVPLYKRIEQFLNENVLPRARQKKKKAGE